MDWNNCLQNVTDSSNKVVGQAATLNCVPVLFSNLVNAAFVFAGSVAVIFIIWSGIQYIMSGGDPKKAEGAKKTLTWSIIGLLLIVFSVAIINILATITGAHCITMFGFNNCQTNIAGN